MDKFLMELGKLVGLYEEFGNVDNVDKCVDYLILFSVRLGKLSVDKGICDWGCEGEFLMGFYAGKRIEYRKIQSVYE